MKNERDIHCPVCGKAIGKSWVVDTMYVKGLGGIDTVETKYDYRKASHTWSGKGTLCRKCAKEKYPEGKRYQVCFMMHGRKHSICGHTDEGGCFASKAEAVKACNKMCDKYGRNSYWVEELKI